MVSTSNHRLVVVANRLPVALRQDSAGQWYGEPSCGGLVTALSPVLRERGGVWIGWSGTVEEDGADLDAALSSSLAGAGYALAPVGLTAMERDKFYLGFSNEIIWPLFHDLQSRCNFDPSYWEAYEQVNRKFARVTAGVARAGDDIWVHDYHLMNLASALRELGVRSPLGFFLHIPFPSPDIFLKLPWREQILRGLLDYSLIGFQAERDRRNFAQCVHTLLPDALVEGEGELVTAHVAGRAVRLGVFPIGIDEREFAGLADSPEVADAARGIRAALQEQQLIFGIDRLDYTKGIPQKLDAFRRALIRYPELRGAVTFTQVVVPSRTGIPEYDDLKTRIEQLVGEINGQFTEPGWVPIHYRYRTLDRVELAAGYRASDIALITPLKDGMNLVAKEYCVCRPGAGALILSEFAGAAAQLGESALMVNPYDVDGVAEAIRCACTMSEDERRRRMRDMRRSIRRHDIFWWVDAFLAARPGDAAAFAKAPQSRSSEVCSSVP